MTKIVDSKTNRDLNQKYRQALRDRDAARDIIQTVNLIGMDKAAIILIYARSIANEV